MFDRKLFPTGAKMDIATVIGLVLGFGLIVTAIIMGGGGIGPFIDPASMMIVFGGALAASLINFPLRNVLGSFGVIMKCFLFKLPDPFFVITTLKELATIAKKDGLLALERKLEDIDDDFLKRGLESLIGGVPPEQLQEKMEAELACIEARHTTGKKFVDSLGAAAPAFGMIGTLIGLVQMLRNLDDPSQIGGGMATALLTTLYGALVANVVCIPLAGKLETRSQEETTLRELMISGIRGLGEGVAPRELEVSLATYLPPKSRDTLAAEG